MYSKRHFAQSSKFVCQMKNSSKMLNRYSMTSIYTHTLIRTYYYTRASIYSHYQKLKLSHFHTTNAELISTISFVECRSRCQHCRKSTFSSLSLWIGISEISHIQWYNHICRRTHKRFFHFFSYWQAHITNDSTRNEEKNILFTLSRLSM